MLPFACIAISSCQKGVLIRLWVMSFQIEKKGKDLIFILENLIVVTMQLE
jgi:hypothetical protein